MPVSARNIKVGDNFTLPKFHHITRHERHTTRGKDSCVVAKNKKGNYEQLGTLCTLGKMRNAGWEYRQACREKIKTALENNSRLVYLGKHKIYGPPKLVRIDIFHSNNVEEMDKANHKWWFNNSARIYHTFYSFGTHETIRIASCYLKFLKKIEL